MLGYSICVRDCNRAVNSCFPRYQPMDVPTGVLSGVSDRFNGITVDSTNTNVTLADDRQFDEMLTSEYSENNTM